MGASEGIAHRHGSLAVGAGSDGINFDTEGLGGFRAGFGVGCSFVIHPVGQENDDAGFRLRILEVGDGGDERRTDGGAILHLTHFQAGDALAQPGAVLGEGADQIGPPGEGHQPDFVIGPLLDELADDVLDHFEPVGGLAIQGEVHRLHGARDVHCEEDIDAAGFDIGGAPAEPWAGEREDEQAQRQQHRQQAEAADPRAWLGAGAEGIRRGGQAQGGGPAAAAFP